MKTKINPREFFEKKTLKMRNLLIRVFVGVQGNVQFREIGVQLISLLQPILAMTVTSPSARGARRHVNEHMTHLVYHGVAVGLVFPFAFGNADRHIVGVE